MGDFLSGVLGTDSSVNVEHGSPNQQIAPWQQTAQGLSSQLQTQVAGGGPNPAQKQFLQNSQQIAQQQATTYAQNRALNPALAARMAGNTAASLQQNAASTAGIQQAQQQLASEQLLGNVAAQQQTALNQAGAINAGIAQGNQQAAGQIIGGLFGGAGAALGMADGGTVPSGSDWQQWAQNSSGVPSAQDWALTMGAPQGEQVSADASNGAQSSIGKFLSGMGSSMQKTNGSQNIMNGITKMLGAAGAGAAMSNGGMLYKSNPKLDKVPKSDRFSGGGTVPVLLSPGEKYLPPNEAQRVATGQESPSLAGKTIPGKAKVSGDSEKNDTVPMQAEEGGIVIPRSKMGSEEEAQKFVAQEMAKHRKTPEGEFREALKRAVSGRKRK